jgi:hypothetical protein
VVDLREHTDIDRLLEQIFEADLVVVW